VIEHGCRMGGRQACQRLCPLTPTERRNLFDAAGYEAE
jgi:hypothetical protein